MEVCRKHNICHDYTDNMYVYDNARIVFNICMLVDAYHGRYLFSLMRFKLS